MKRISHWAKSHKYASRGIIAGGSVLMVASGFGLGALDAASGNELPLWPSAVAAVLGTGALIAFPSRGGKGKKKKRHKLKNKRRNRLLAHITLFFTSFFVSIAAGNLAEKNLDHLLFPNEAPVVHKHFAHGSKASPLYDPSTARMGDQAEAPAPKERLVKEKAGRSGQHLFSTRPNLTKAASFFLFFLCALAALALSGLLAVLACSASCSGSGLLGGVLGILAIASLVAFIVLLVFAFISLGKSAPQNDKRKGS